jgi:hypothetical protein
MMSRFLMAALLSASAAFPAAAQDAPAPAQDKSGYTLFNPTPDAALRAFNTDRPTKSNSPITVDAGRFQYETDLLNYTHSNAGGVSTRLYTTLDPVLKLGLTNRIDLELQFNGYTWFNVHTPGGAQIATGSGPGDLVVRAKINMFGNEGGPALALIPYVKLPTASRSIGNGQTEGGLVAPLSVPLPWDFLLVAMPEIDVLKNANDNGRHVNFTQLINISHPIGPKMTVYGELYSALGADKRTPPVYTFDAAISYALTDTLQLDVGANIGLNRNAPNLQLYTGVAQRF